MSFEIMQDLIKRLNSLKSKSSSLPYEIYEYVENRYKQLTTFTTIDYLIAAIDTDDDRPDDLIIKALMNRLIASALPPPSRPTSAEFLDQLLNETKHSASSRPGTASSIMPYNFSKSFFDMSIMYLNGSPKLQGSYNKILGCIDIIEKNFFYSEIDQEDNLRPVFVGIQSIFEETITNMLQNKEIDDVIGIIHTKLPATPVCTNPDNPEPSIHESNRDNPEIVYTISSRANVIRKYLESHGVLYIVYSDEAKKERTEEQLSIFQELTEKFVNLKDKPINVPVSEEISGATYILNSKTPEKYVFSINARQAANKTEKKEWVLYFGPFSSRVIRSRLEKILNFLKDQGLNLE